MPKFGKIAKPHKAADYYDYCYGFANSNPDSNGTDSDFYRPRLLGHYWCMVNGTPVELPVYHVRDARDYIRWWLDDKLSILTTAPCGCSVKEGTSLVLVCAQVIDWVRFPTAAHPEPCNSNPIRCLERNNQPNRLK